MAAPSSAQSVNIPETFNTSRSLVTPRHRCIVMNEVVNESLRKICHYQQDVPQHYYFLDTLVLSK